MSDNIQIKDGLSNELTLRAKDIVGDGSLFGAMSIPIDETGTEIFKPANPGITGEVCAVVSASFNRPANTTRYEFTTNGGQLVANSVTVGTSGVVPMALPIARVNGGTGKVARGRLTKSGTSTTNAVFRAHFYKTMPSPANGDGGDYLTPGALSYIGSMDFDMTGANARVFEDGVKVIGVPNVGAFIIFDAASNSQNIYALLEARGEYVPVSGETFTLALEVTQN